MGAEGIAMPGDPDDINLLNEGRWPAKWEGAPRVSGFAERLRVVSALRIGAALAALLIGWPVFNLLFD